MDNKKILRDVYLNQNSSAYLGGISAVIKEAKRRKSSITEAEVRKFLEGQDVYTLHKTAERRFPRNRMVPSGLDSHWQADLMDLRPIKRYNKGFSYVLLVIDVLSKYIWLEGMKDKRASTTAAAFKKIVDKSGRRPWFLMTDKGNEFAADFRRLMKAYDIQHFNSPSPAVKAAIAERAIRTVKGRMWRYFTLKKTFAWTDILPKIADSINRTVSSVTKHAPVDVTPDNQNRVLRIAFGKEKPNLPKTKPNFKYEIGDKVRILTAKSLYRKGYLPSFSTEIFVIKERLPRNPPVYKLRDLKGEDIEGVFYHAELSRSRNARIKSNGR